MTCSRSRETAAGRSVTAAVSLLSSFKLWAMIVCLLLASACAHEGDPQKAIPPASVAPTPVTVRHLANAASSPEELARGFLRALAVADVSTLKALRLTKAEFCDHVFPELPSSKVPNLSCDFAWDQATLRSDGGLYDLLSSYGGKRYELVSLRFAGGTEPYKTYRVIKDARLVVRDEKGEEKEVKLFGSMLEMDGRYKLFSFVFH
jgi:hypothetical protein